MVNKPLASRRKLGFLEYHLKQTVEETGDIVHSSFVALGSMTN
jgi:hypothetical protein